MTEVDAAKEANRRHFLERGRRPGLSYGYQRYVIARRPSTGEILIGGLGSLGTGELWLTENADDHARLPGYADAEIV